jgi:superfamily II DNA/RNA helicase
MPDDSFIRFSGNEKEDKIKRNKFLPILHKIYEFESKRISGSHGGQKRFSDCYWTIDEISKYVCEELGKGEQEIKPDINELISILSNSDARHLLRFRKGEVYQHITRVAEMIRTTGNLHEFHDRTASNTLPQKNLIMDGTIWEPRLRYSAPREISKEKLLERVRNLFPLDHKLPQVIGGHSIDIAMEDLKTVLDSMEKLRKYSPRLEFSEFQAKSIETAFMQSWAKDTNKTMVITAGTGMGKTLGFAIPVITDSLIMNRNQNVQVCSQILLYPRNDLAQDQYSELNKYVKQINRDFIANNQSERCIGVALDAASRIKDKKERYPVSQGVKGSPSWGIGGKNVWGSSIDNYGGEKPSSIVACSIESFRKRLKYPDVIKGLKKGLQRIVLDEIHLSSGLQGGHHIRLIKRLRQIVYDLSKTPDSQRKICFIGVSATIAKPREHLKKISNEWDVGNVDHIDSKNLENISPRGIMHHVMIRPRSGTPPIGAVTDMTSSITHQRRSRNFYNRPTKPKQLQKTVAFADSHEVVGNWLGYLRENEGTDIQQKTQDEIYTVLTWGNPPRPKRLPRPYSQWHERPLRIHPGGEEICNKCQKMEHHDKPIIVQANDINKFRSKIGDELSGNYSSFQLPTINEDIEQLEISGLETCPHLEAGSCWWFAPRNENPNETFEGRPDDGMNRSFKQVMRVKKHTSKSKGKSTEEKGNSDANYSFIEKANQGAYPRVLRRENGRIADEERFTDIPHDIVVATPTLEVGVDMDNVTEILTHKAIRNISSYRQKIGRAGREIGSDSIGMTLVSNNGNDFQHYRSMTRLIDRDIVEPIPVSENNLAIKKHHAYEAIYDYLALNGYKIELIGRHAHDKDGFEKIGRKIESAINKICNLDSEEKPISIKSDCNRHLKFIVEEYEIRNEAAKIVAKHLSILLEKNRNGHNILQYISTLNASRIPKNPAGNKKIWDKLKDEKSDLTDDYFSEEMIKQFEEILENKDIDKLLQWIDNLDDEKYMAPKNVLKHYTKKAKTDVKPQHDLFDEIFRIYSEDMRQNKPGLSTTYLSDIILNCKIFQKDAPYCLLPTLFTNPHEEPVIVNHSRISETITRKDALKYLIPGMWTHRLFNGRRMFVKHNGHLIDDGNNKWRMELGDETNLNVPKLDFVGELNEVHRIPKILNLDLEQESIETYQIKEINVKLDNGFKGNGNQVMINPENGLTTSIYGDADIPGSAPIPAKRPKAFPISWMFSRTSETVKDIETYKISKTKPTTTSEPVAHNVTHHPLLDSIFKSIEFDEEMEVEKFVFGVARDNGNILKPTIDDTEIAFSDEFNTKGIRFTIKEEFLNKITNKDYNEHVFDERVLRMVSWWILNNNNLFNTTPWVVKAYMDILVDQVWNKYSSEEGINKFPETGFKFLEFLFTKGNTIEPEVYQRRAAIETVTSDDRRDDFVRDLETLNKKFIKEKDDLIKNYGKEMSSWYRFTMLNTLAIKLSQSVSELAGVQGDSVAYSLDNENGLIDVFDNDATGNGSTELSNTYFHIPIEIRDLAEHFEDYNLPTDSFIDILEKNLQVCEEHIMHSIAVSGVSPERINPWIEEEAKEIGSIRRYGKIWKKFIINNTREATLHNRRRFSETTDRAELLDFEVGLSLCDVECPACKGDSFANLLPAPLAEFGTCTGVLDELIGDWSLMDGYLKQFANSKELAECSGDQVPSGKYVNIIGEKLGSIGVRQLFVKYPCPPVSYAWVRGMDVPEKLDFSVRYMELL